MKCYKILLLWKSRALVLVVEILNIKMGRAQKTRLQLFDYIYLRTSSLGHLMYSVLKASGITRIDNWRIKIAKELIPL